MSAEPAAITETNPGEQIPPEAPSQLQQIKDLEAQQPAAVMTQGEVFNNLRQAEPPRPRPVPHLTIRERLTKWWEELEKSEGPDQLKKKRNFLITNIVVFTACAFLVSPAAEYINNLK